MADTATATTSVEHTGEASDIVHLTCCVDRHPTRAICGWVVAGEEPLGPDAEPECVVCVDIVLADRCPNGGYCPEETSDG